MSTVRLFYVHGEIPPKGYRFDENGKLIPLGPKEKCAIKDKFGQPTILSSQWYEDNA